MQGTHYCSDGAHECGQGAHGGGKDAHICKGVRMRVGKACMLQRGTATARKVRTQARGRRRLYGGHAHLSTRACMSSAQAHTLAGKACMLAGRVHTPTVRTQTPSKGVHGGGGMRLGWKR
jgi:hypothetical protein